MRNRGVFPKTHGSRQRLFWLFGGIALVILAGVFALFSQGTKEKGRIAGPPKTKEEALERLRRDTDGDGLKDWEEKIYGTNPEKADTDGDGTSDGDEIKLSRNPLRAGPDDQLSVTLPQPEDDNKTQALANEFIGRSLTQVIAEGVAGGRSLNDIAADTTQLQTYIAKLGQERLLDKVIPPESREFVISSDNSAEAVKKYFNTITQIYISNFSKIESDIQILHLAATGNNPKALRRLDINIAAIENTIAEIKKTPVPTKWLEFAKNDAWYLLKTLAAVKIIRNSEVDPVASLLILQNRVQLTEERRDFYLQTRAELSAAGITFTQNEPAAGLLLQGLQ